MRVKDTMYLQKFKDSEGKIVEKYIWVSDMEKENYPQDHNKQPLTPIFEEEKPESIFPTIITGNKMSRQDIQIERRKRSSDHFKKEILPTLGRDERIHHKRKQFLENNKKK